MTTAAPTLETPLTRMLGISTPIICGAMYPCSNPELVAAVSNAGGIGVVQPLTLVFVHKLDFREGVRRIRSLTAGPIGMNLIVEKSSRTYENRMRGWLDVALDEGIRFFVTALGNPAWVVARVRAAGGTVFHDVTERRWALKARDAGVDGLICVNNRAGGHAGPHTPAALIESLHDLGLPLVCAGGIGDATAFVEALRLGYCGVQMGTRFIATTECASHDDYKRAVIAASADDIVLTDRVTGVPLSVIRTPWLQRTGTRVSAAGRFLLKHPRTRHWARLYYSSRSVWQLRRSSTTGYSTRDFYQAGKSAGSVQAIEPVRAIVDRLTRAAVAGGV